MITHYLLYIYWLGVLNTLLPGASSASLNKDSSQDEARHTELTNTYEQGGHNDLPQDSKSFNMG